MTIEPAPRYASWIPQSRKAIGVLCAGIAIAAVPVLFLLLMTAGSTLACVDSCERENLFLLFLLLAVATAVTPFLGVWLYQEVRPLPGLTAKPVVPAVALAVIVLADLAVLAWMLILG